MVVNPYFEAAAAFTVIEDEVALRDPSLAVRVLEPEVFRVIVKFPTPLVRVADAGRVADGSDEVSETVPL
jgi:hypothetical protein